MASGETEQMWCFCGKTQSAATAAHAYRNGNRRRRQAIDP
jgi:hypothetical protein